MESFAPVAATVFVVDDDPDVRQALDRLLRAWGWNVSAYASARAFLDHGPAVDRGCVLLDVSMPGMTGLELHEQLLERGVTYPVIYLTGACTLSSGVKAMKSGALDVLEKPIDEDALLRVVTDAIELDARAHAARARLDTARERLSRLTARERQVMEHVIVGRLNKQIAAELGIAEKTVKVHRGRVMDKMEVRSVAELVHLCDELHMRDAG